jgi:DNA-binding CsgD family transcriptional regulator
MPTLTLTEAQQMALRALMSIEPTPGCSMPSPEVLRLIEKLVPCDAMGVSVVGNDGCLMEEVVLPSSYAEMFPEGGETGPLYVGVMHWGPNGAEGETCGALDGVRDGIAVGFCNGTDAVSQIWFDRLRHDFTDDDLARLALVIPILQRLLRVRHTPHLPAALTVQERRVLMLVANGLSNPEIAAHLFVSVATVRKHLEHAYRKLGVHNRMAAVVAFEGGTVAHPERAGLIEKYA